MFTRCLGLCPGCDLCGGDGWMGDGRCRGLRDCFFRCFMMGWNLGGNCPWLAPRGGYRKIF